MTMKYGGNPYVPTPKRTLISVIVCLVFVTILGIAWGGCSGDEPSTDNQGSSKPAKSAPLPDTSPDVKKDRPVKRGPDVSNGQKLFQANCAICHGVNGKGDGPAAPALPKKPKDLTKPEIQNLPSNVLSQKIRNGVPENSMPPWKHLNDKEMADLVAYIKTFK